MHICLFPQPQGPPAKRMRPTNDPLSNEAQREQDPEKDDRQLMPPPPPPPPHQQQQLQQQQQQQQQHPVMPQPQQEEDAELDELHRLAYNLMPLPAAYWDRARRILHPAFWNQL